GGAGKIATKLVGKLKPMAIRNGMKVTALAPSTSGGVSVTCNNSTLTKATYDHVINTLPFSCLRVVDTSAYDFDWALLTAIHAIRYEASTKVAISFKERWWENLSTRFDSLVDQRGGVSKTDLPTRMVVYPSYGINQMTGATIIVSYTWAQDVARLGALIDGGPGTTQNETLKNLILRDLTAIHGIPDGDFLPNLVAENGFDAWAWYNYEHSAGMSLTPCPESRFEITDIRIAGAFARFGPGQFQSLYPQVTKPVNGTLHFAGEATSTHHAWVLGALESAARAVLEIIRRGLPSTC
ncbi:amine oxidase, partial [Amylostereum chailletii]